MKFLIKKDVEIGIILNLLFQSFKSLDSSCGINNLIHLTIIRDRKVVNSSGDTYRVGELFSVKLYNYSVCVNQEVIKFQFTDTERQSMNNNCFYSPYSV